MSSAPPRPAVVERSATGGCTVKLLGRSIHRCQAESTANALASDLCTVLKDKLKDESPSPHWAAQDKAVVATVAGLEVTIDTRGVAFGHQLTVTIGREIVVSLFITGGHFMHWLVVKAPVDCPIVTLAPADDSEEEMKRHMDAFFGCFRTPAVVEFVKSFLGIK